RFTAPTDCVPGSNADSISAKVRSSAADHGLGPRKLGQQARRPEQLPQPALEAAVTTEPGTGARDRLLPSGRRREPQGAGDGEAGDDAFCLGRRRPAESRAVADGIDM